MANAPARQEGCEMYPSLGVLDALMLTTMVSVMIVFAMMMVSSIRTRPRQGGRP